MESNRSVYPAIKSLHITCVILSAAGFVLRGWWMITGSPWVSARITRVLPHLVDSLLLLSAITLASLSRQLPFVDSWLTAKVLGLLFYIGLGALALRPGRPRGIRVAAFVLALLTYSFIVSVALSKNPLGWLAVLFQGP